MAFAAALLALQQVESTPLRLFERACLATSGDRSAFQRVMEDVGGEREAAPKSRFEEAETITAFNVGDVSIQLETFAAINDWVDAPLAGADLLLFLQTARDPRRSVPQVHRTAPASSICMVQFDQGDDDLRPELETLVVNGRALADIGGVLDFQAYRWRVDGDRLTQIQYGRADLRRDSPGTRSVLSASFKLP
ncbi:hypothetical protein [Brevundimonas sp.]|uniref:hypothetical protein n=1 Tax=Brevundimonas sp. TaxID=1871086 RepID=UPI00257FB06F|nr:hypothetical protein [Brevundimonas sp.]